MTKAQTKKLLKAVQSLVDHMNTTNSSLEKTEIFEQHLDLPVEGGPAQDIANVLLYTFNPYFQYQVKSKTVRKSKNIAARTSITTDLFELLDGLRFHRWGRGRHDIIGIVKGFVAQFPEYEDLIFNIIDGDLKMRFTASSINQAWRDWMGKSLIPGFDVALAKTYEPGIPDFSTDTWLASRKLDGVRCVIVVENGKATAFSRAGKTFDTLQKVLDEIESLGVDNMAFDGEICVIDKHGNDDFQGVMREIKKKDHTMDKPQFRIFDMVDLDAFRDSTIVTDPLSKRLQRLTEIIMDDNRPHRGLKHVRILAQHRILNDRDFQAWVDLGVRSNWEGIMIRKDVPYEGKRTKNLLKVKQFHDAEYKVLAIECGPVRHIVNGQEVTSEMMTNVIIKHKGHLVSVGSGFSIEQRQEFHKNPKRIIGKDITVQYFEETTDKKGGHSLRFPTAKTIWSSTRDC